jgi:hypothetical protein
MCPPHPRSGAQFLVHCSPIPLPHPLFKVTDLLPAGDVPPSDEWILSEFAAWHSGMLHTRETWLAGNDLPPRLSSRSCKETGAYWAIRVLEIIRNSDALSMKCAESGVPVDAGGESEPEDADTRAQADHPALDSEDEEHICLCLCICLLIYFVLFPVVSMSISVSLYVTPSWSLSVSTCLSPSPTPSLLLAPSAALSVSWSQSLSASVEERDVVAQQLALDAEDGDWREDADLLDAEPPLHRHAVVEEVPRILENGSGLCQVTRELGATRLPVTSPAGQPIGQFVHIEQQLRIGGCVYSASHRQDTRFAHAI